MCGHVQGRFLEFLVFLAQPRFVLEIGTFTGYSAMWMAGALPPGARVVSCEVSPEFADFARHQIAVNGFGGRIEVRTGDALEIIRNIHEPVDLVFMDADKALYLDFYEAVLPLLSPRGLIIADDTLWHGDVARECPDDPRADALRQFNDVIISDPRVVCVQLPIRNGVTLIRPATGEATAAPVQVPRGVPIQLADGPNTSA